MFRNRRNKPVLYIDIDGVLLANEHHLSEGATEFIKYIVDNFDVYWLTTHCMEGDPDWAVEYVNRCSPEDLSLWLNKFKPTAWSINKTEAIDFTKPFLWFDDDCYPGELKELIEHKTQISWIEIDLHKNNKQLTDVLLSLKQI